VARVPAGEAFSLSQTVTVEKAISNAEAESGLRFSVYVGPLTGDARQNALSLHAAASPDPSRLVLIAIDLAGKRLEIVTGEAAKHDLDDRSCALAALSMTSALSGGDLVGAIVDGLGALAEHARHPKVLHTDQP
jgi:Domain of unknown function (DUF5130)